MGGDLLTRPGPRWLVVGDTPAGALPAGAIAVRRPARRRPDRRARRRSTPTRPALIAFTSGTTKDPKGVIHSHRTITCEARQLDHMFPSGGPPHDHRRAGRPLHRDAQRLRRAAAPRPPGEPGRRVGSRRGPPPDAGRRTSGVGGGATFFLTSLLDHPDFTDEHLARMPFAGLGGSSVPAAVTERATRLGIKAFRSYGSTEHPSITGCADRRARGQAPLHRRPPAARASRCASTSDGEISSRGPDCFVGYTDPALTASVFDADGWYRTGDVGVLDDDGYLTITDRVSDIIIRGGENISAQEVEELLARASTASPRSAWSRRPTSASASTPPPSSACATARRPRPSRTCGPTWPRPGLAKPEVAGVALHRGGRPPAHAVGQGAEVPACARASRDGAALEMTFYS